MSETVVSQWQPYDFAFASHCEYENPFAVPFRAIVHTPSSGAFVVDGFYDGDSVWKLRIAPWEPGIWSFRTESNDPNLNGREATFRCVENANPAIHGGLKIDSEHPRHFIWEDGRRYFLLGYECDWLWALDLTPNGTSPDGIPTVDRFLDQLAANGFNHVIMNAYAHDCGWQEGTTGTDDYGPPPLYAWGGTNESPDHSRFNLAYWQHYDQIMDALMRRGIVAHIMIKVYNKMVNWPEPSSDLDDRFFRWLIARYAAYPNTVWDFSKESNNEPDLAYKLDRIRLIRRYDPYGRLITTHDDEHEYMNGSYDDVLDFHSDQHHQDWHAETLRKRSARKWPIVNVELGYEHGPKGLDDFTYGVVQAPEEVVRRAWEVCMAGGYATYYYTYTAWDVIRPDDVPPGYAYFRNLATFFAETNWWRMKPVDHLIRITKPGERENEIYCLADAGAEYIVVLNRPAEFELTLEGYTEFVGRWYDPLAGTWSDAGTFGPGVVQVTRPTEHDAAPIVLYLTR